MTRRRRRRGNDGITLFPFLAVLICTMGSLIVLLVVVVQQAKANAESVARARQAQQEVDEQRRKELTEKKDEFDWRIEVLESSRQQTAEQLENRRRELSYLEQEIREVSEQLDAAVDEARRIAEQESNEEAKVAASQEQVEELRQRLERAEKDLELARDALAKRKPSYAIVAYDGPHGTERRPLFIECTGERVVLQPEGVELYSVDFQPPITDNNPLASALRAKREYLARTFRTEDDHPYPLIVVRPDGAQAYAAARMAMKSWDSEFGYELIDDEVELSYPKPDPALTEIVQDAVEEARFQRQQLRSIAPARFGRRQPATLTASRNGGFVSNGGDDASSRGYGRGSYGGRGSGSPYGPPQGGNGLGSQPGGGRGGVDVGTAASRGSDRGYGGTGSGGANPSMGSGIGSPSGAGLTGSPQGAQISGVPNGSGTPASGGAGSFGGTGSAGQTGAPFDPSGQIGRGGGTGAGGDDRDPYEPSPEDLANAGNDQGRFEASGTGGPHGGNAANGATSPPSQKQFGRGSAENGRQLYTGARSNSSGSSSQSSQGSPSGARGSSQGAQGPSFGSPGQPSSLPGAMPNTMSAMQDLQPMADSRGQDWGLPSGGQGLVGITRPIPVVLTGRYLDILPEDRGGKSERIEFRDSMHQGMDEMVTKLWTRMERWGIAGPGMHWKPVLSVRVHASGERRYEELERLLENSGIVVKRKN